MQNPKALGSLKQLDLNHAVVPQLGGPCGRGPLIASMEDVKSAALLPE